MCQQTVARGGVVALMVIGLGCTMVQPDAGQNMDQSPAASEPTRVLRGVIVKIEEPLSLESTDRGTAAEDALTLAGSLVERAIGGGWQGGFAVSDPFAFTFEPSRASASASRGPQTVGDAWDRIYEIREGDDVAYAEPVFAEAADVAPGRDDWEPHSRDLMPHEACVPASNPDPTEARDLAGALADPEWSLGPQGANVLAAWELFEQRGMQPGAGVVIGHPDTGYREHPMIRGGDGQPVIAEDGFDFVDNDRLPFDETTAGLLLHPGHGTRTASVIVGRRSRLAPGSPIRISGVAPAARLIPLRVTRGVLVLPNHRNLVSGIRHAAGFDRNLVRRKVDVISMSLGTPPSRSLRDALRAAERNNVIVLAAAGNHFKKVVWPARYDSVAAVAATNVNSRPWSGSAGGKSVEVSAPGESVWVASTRFEEDGTVRNCFQTGDGTSYAVATTAGIAALWLSFHNGSDALEALKDEGRVSWAFREVLRQAVRTPDGWDARRHGPGIVDAHRVLTAPLPEPPLTLESAQDPCEQDLDAALSIFEDAPRPRGRLARLLAIDEERMCEVAVVGDEIARLYATDAEVRDAMDAISEPADPDSDMVSLVRELLGTRDISDRLRSTLQ